jgi:pimeloyl-ACP methyl ester carboxylesterase
LAALVLADTKAEGDDAAAKVNRDKMIATARSGPASAILETMLPKVVGATTHAERPEVIAAVRQLASVQRPEAIVGALQALRDRPDATPWLGAVRVPTLVMVGSEDTLTPPAVAEKLAQAIPGGRLVRIEKAGHLASAENADAFNDMLMAFLTGVS